MKDQVLAILAKKRKEKLNLEREIESLTISLKAMLKDGEELEGEEAKVVWAHRPKRNAENNLAFFHMLEEKDIDPMSLGDWAYVPNQKKIRHAIADGYLRSSEVDEVFDAQKVFSIRLRG